jgi:predicted DNA-binding transcriptional regulator AlpA
MIDHAIRDWLATLPDEAPVKAAPVQKVSGMSRSAFYAAVAREEIETLPRIGRSVRLTARGARRVVGMQREKAA